jgi:uncharacterized protein
MGINRELPAIERGPSSRWILSLAGGGYKGLFTARFLELLEERIERKMYEAVDLVAGTSIGSILALGIASGKSAKELKQLLMSRGSAIFPWRRRALPMLLGTLCGPRYLQTPLRKALIAQFKETKLRDLRVPAIVPAVALTDASCRIFRTPHAADFVADAGCQIVDVALCSAAAPLYFPPHRLGDVQLADGGLVANAPHAIAVIESTAVLRWPLNDTHMLAVGTTEVPTGVAAKPSAISWGWIGWARRKTLLEQTMSAQQDLAHQLTKSLLGARFTAVDSFRSLGQDRVTGLDVASKKATRTLLALAESSWTVFESQYPQVITQLKNHEPERLQTFG